MSVNCSANTDANGISAAARALTLLVADDNNFCRKILRSYLEPHFRHIYFAEDGNDGFRQFCEYRPDIVIADQLMSGLCGLELTTKIRNSGISTYVVLMTTAFDNQILLEALNQGVDRFVPKPLHYKQIFNTINRVVREIVNERLLEQLQLQASGPQHLRDEATAAGHEELQLAISLAEAIRRQSSMIGECNQLTHGLAKKSEHLRSELSKI